MPKATEAWSCSGGYGTAPVRAVVMVLLRPSAPRMAGAADRIGFAKPGTDEGLHVDDCEPLTFNVLPTGWRARSFGSRITKAAPPGGARPTAGCRPDPDAERLVLAMRD